MGDDDLTADGFLRRVAAKRAVAEKMVDDKSFSVEAFVASGFAFEFALKALIMKQRGWNAWPAFSQAKELYSHDLRGLMKEAGIDLGDVPAYLRPSVKQALDWTRGHDYYEKKMPRPIARSMVDAVFGDRGVIAWLMTMQK